MLVCKMRTTLVIPDPLFKRAKLYARKHDKNLSDVFAEALDERLTREEQAVREPRAEYKVKATPMGTASVDLSDRDALNKVMDEP